MRCEYAREDGAYVLGALSPAERAVYERHLSGCPSCREGVAELAVLPGLLGRLDAATAEQVAQASTALEASAALEPPRLPRLIAAAQVERARQRRRWRAGVAAFVAACLIAVAAIGVGVWRELGVDEPSPVTLVAMTPVSGTGAVTAEVGITETTGGTLVTVHCAYRANDRRRPYTFRLYAVAVDGSSEQVASWSAAPGDELRFAGLTRFDRSSLDRIELRRADGTPILVYSLR